VYYLKENHHEISKSLNQKGLSVVKSLLIKKDINNIKRKAKKLLNIPKYLGSAFNVKFASKHTTLKSKLKGVTRELNYKLSRNILKRGYKYYSKLTNSIEILNPLLNFPELRDYIFQKDIIAIAKKYLKTEDPKILYVAFRIHFPNTIPENDFNFFHSDDRSFFTKKEDKLLKLLIPFHLKKGIKIEFNQLTISKKKMNISEKFFQGLQYSKKKDFPKRFKNFFLKPNVKNQDAYFFDPDNFFHNAEKPKTLRIMAYFVFGRKNSFLAKKSKLIKINKKYFNHLPQKFVNFGSLLKKIV